MSASFQDRAFVPAASSPQAVSPVPASIPSADLADILRRAADILEPEGAWTQGAFSRNADGSVDKDGHEDPDGVAENPVCWCVVGAISVAAGVDLFHQRYPLRGPHQEAVDVLSDVLGTDPADWNDEPDRRQEEVVESLRTAAQAIEAQRAETQGGSVHESAVPQGCAQNPTGAA